MASLQIKRLRKSFKRFLYTSGFKQFWHGTVKRLPWTIKRNIVWYTRKHKCEYCDIALIWDAYTVDHYMPKSKGGTNKLNNLRICCKRCNKVKSDQLPSSELFAHLWKVRTKPRKS